MLHLFGALKSGKTASHWRQSFPFQFSRNAFTTKNQAKKSSTYPPRSSASEAALPPSKRQIEATFFKERNGNEVLLVGTNLNFLEWKKSLFLLMFVMSTKTLLVDVFWHKNCSHVYTCVKRNSVHALANTKQDGTFNVLHIFPVQLLHLLFVNSFTKGTHGVP